MAVLHHIAFIPDGNRRWAHEHGIDEYYGHEIGFLQVAPTVLEHVWKSGIHTATLWFFSTENWKRPQEAIDYVMPLYVQLIEQMIEISHCMKVRIIHLGRKDRIPSMVGDVIAVAERVTMHYDQHVFNIALDYGGRDAIIRACKKLIEQYKLHGVNELDDKVFAAQLDTVDQPYPNPDLIIRTSGEHRQSGFMPWETEYSEFYFEQRHFPDLSIECVQQAIADYHMRQRRLGK